MLSRPRLARVLLHARGACTTSASVGTSVCSEVADVSRASLWEAMCVAIVNPQLFLPVSRVKLSRQQQPTLRTMTFDGTGPMHGEAITEHIYLSSGAGEIMFVPLDGEDSRNEHLFEVVHALRTDPLRLEYFQRNRHTKERSEALLSNIYLNAHERESSVRAIEATFELAREIEAEAAEEDDWASGAWR